MCSCKMGLNHYHNMFVQNCIIQSPEPFSNQFVLLNILRGNVSSVCKWARIERAKRSEITRLTRSPLLRHIQVAVHCARFNWQLVLIIAD